MSELTEILKGVANVQYKQSGLPKKALPMFIERIKSLYYSATDKQKAEMREGFKSE